jgi:phage shock protein PspC (stress-responsive transcriptional regulator)
MSPTAPPPESPQDFDPSRLSTLLNARRSQDDRMLAGVCGGLGAYLGVDPVLLRVGFAVLTIFGGLGAVAYAALWLLLPEAGSDESIASQRSGRPDAELRTVVLVVAALLAIGVLGGSAWFLPFHIPWPIFIVIGIWWFVSQRHRRYRRGWAARRHGPHDPWASGWKPGSHWGMSPGSARPDVASADEQVAAGETPDSGAGETPTSGAGETPDSSVSGAPSSGADTTVSSVVDWSQPDPLGLYTQSEEPSVPPPPPPPRPPSLFWPTIGSALVAVGTLALVDLIHGGVAPAAYPLLGLGVVGLGLIIGSVGARSRGLIPVGVLLAVGVVLASVAPDPRFGQITATPHTAADIQASYELTAGEVDLDLTHVDDVSDLNRTIEIKVVTGHINVMVPAGVDLIVESHATAGDLEILGRQADGTNPELDVTPDNPTATVPDLVLDLQVGLGEVDVTKP